MVQRRMESASSAVVLDLDGEVRLPDQVEGIPVTRLGPYLFSDGMERAGILKRMKAPLFLWEEG